SATAARSRRASHIRTSIRYWRGAGRARAARPARRTGTLPRRDRRREYCSRRLPRNSPRTAPRPARCRATWDRAGCARNRGSRAGRRARPRSYLLEADLLRALPQHGLAERSQVLQPRGQSDEVVAGELAHLAREMQAAIGQQDFGFADAAGIKDNLAGRGIAGVVLVGDAEIEIAERHPDTLAAPAHMNGLALERHRLAKRRHGFWRQLLLETGLEGEFTGAYNQLAHRSLLLDTGQDVVKRYQLQPEQAEARPFRAGSAGQPIRMR